MHQHPARHAEPAPAYVVPASAPLVHQPRPYDVAGQPVLLPAPAAERRALVQLEDGSWVAAYVPAAPPVVIPAAPEAAPRRPLSALERGAITVVGSVCALTLTGAGALAMVGAATLAAAANLALGAAALLGTSAAAWAVLRLTGALRPASAPSSPTSAPAAPVTVNVTGHGGTGGRWASRGGTGVRIDHLTINQ
ncbi:hypothetical protein ACGFXC_36925 [Streptomyces sp. NPDC048507]|uniref:hypothetical protein n=1 Tax=Streptomyces sp. NPDC048507 TaxID=3365560 RepID=UPI0037201D3C